MSAPPPRRAREAQAWLVAFAVLAAGWLVYHRALVLFFSQDDFGSLARTLGILPRMVGPWRYVGNQLVFDAMRPLAGLDPLPYHLVTLGVHLACGALLYLLLARRLPAPAAGLGAAFWVTHPALFTSVYWISVVADSLALAFALGALLAFEEAGRRRWAAVPLYALSLLSKESTLLVPLAALVLERWAPRADLGDGHRAPPAPRDPVLWALAALAASYVVYFVTSAYGAYFARPGAGGEPGSGAYAVGLGGNLLANLSTYLGWTAAFLLPSVRGFSDAVDRLVFPYALGLALVWAAGLAWPRLRRSGWLAGGLLYLLLVLPVLPLLHHTYHYYLCAPLAGAAWCVAAAASLLVRRRPYVPVPRPGRRAARAAEPALPATTGWALSWSVFALASALLALNGWAVVRRIEFHPFVVEPLRAEPMVDRALIAQRAARDLRAASLPPGTRLFFWSPQTAADSAADGPSYWERNVRAALLDGLAVRVLFPQVESVAFVRDFRPAAEPWLWAVYRLDGSLKVATTPELDSLLAAGGAGAAP